MHRPDHWRDYLYHLLRCSGSSFRPEAGEVSLQDKPEGRRRGALGRAPLESGEGPSRTGTAALQNASARMERGMTATFWSAAVFRRFGKRFGDGWFFVASLQPRLRVS